MISRTRLRVGAALAALALAATACGGGNDEADLEPGAGAGTAKPSFAPETTMAKLQAKGKIVVGTKFDQPLYGQKGLNNEVEGFDVEIAKIIAAEIGVEPEFVEAISKNREPFIEKGTVDMVVATYTINDKRKKVVDFAGPYYLTGQSLMVKKDDDTIKSKDDLAGKRVCSVEGSTPAERIVEVAPQAKVTLLKAYGECVEAMKNGQQDVLTTDETILLGVVSEDKDLFKVVGEPFSEEPYGIGVKKGDQAFRDFINDVLEKIYKDGRWAAAQKKTVGTVQENLPGPPAVDRYTSS